MAGVRRFGGGRPQGRAGGNIFRAARMAGADKRTACADLRALRNLPHRRTVVAILPCRYGRAVEGNAHMHSIHARLLGIILAGAALAAAAPAVAADYPTKPVRWVV